MIMIAGRSGGLQSPIHTGEVNGKPLRFFRSPKPGPQMPWHVHDDLVTCLGLPRDLRRYFMRKMVNHWKDDIVTVATKDGIVTIAPHYVAQGLIGAVQDAKMAALYEGIERDYTREGAKALSVLTRFMGPEESVQYLVAAYKSQ